VDQWVVALLSAFLGAVVGAVASTLGAMSVERVGIRRTSRARQLRELVPPVRNAVDAGLDELGEGRGPIPMSHLVGALEAIEREGLVAGRKDAQRASHLQELANEVWRLERAVWGNAALGRTSTMEADEAIEAQTRLLIRVGGRIENHELWLRRHLLKPWWRRRPSL
jgi:hypothetical protein